MAEKKKKSCFIIMPLTVPDHLVSVYRDGRVHFAHVLDHLIIPCVTAAGYHPIPPKAKGSDVIQAGIIQHLETADLVLCDMSALNPNVFFEFGIRTALNKPVCVITDDITTNIPFDVGDLNRHEYRHGLEVWDLEDEKSKLTPHILSAIHETPPYGNALWEVFGMRTPAKPSGDAAPTDAMERLNLQIESLSQTVREIDRRRIDTDHTFPKTALPTNDVAGRAVETFLAGLSAETVLKYELEPDDRVARIVVQKGISTNRNAIDGIYQRIRGFGWKAVFYEPSTNGTFSHISFVPKRTSPSKI